ncbi:MAG TPA: beta-galactosidase, partial [Puia sp.]
MKLSICTILALSVAAASAMGQGVAVNLPRIQTVNGRHTLLVDNQPFLILGGQAHNSSAWPALLPNVWTAVEQMHLNTLELPVYWEQLEPQQGKYDFSLVDTLLTQARSHKIRLVLLWFATWKNGSNHYMPLWMKHDPQKYPNVTGNKGQPIDSPSPLSEATQEADTKAFAAFMRHLKETDAEQHTVIMVQVENESGAWGSVRDYSAKAQKLFEGPVPAALRTTQVLNALTQGPGTNAATANATWRQLFGDRADEYFHAWSVASFIGKVAAAGKAEYPLPLYVNAALRDPLTNPTAENYESGGPTDNVIPIWKAAAPAIDLLAPDIYLDGTDRVEKVLELYSRPDNALFIPEIGHKPGNAKYFYAALANGAIGFSPFGIDDNGSGETLAETTHRLAPFAANYAVTAPLMPQLAKWAAEGKIKTVVEPDDHAERSVDLGTWKAIVHFGLGEREKLAP